MDSFTPAGKFLCKPLMFIRRNTSVFPPKNYQNTKIHFFQIPLNYWICLVWQSSLYCSIVYLPHFSLKTSYPIQKNDPTKPFQNQNFLTLPSRYFSKIFNIPFWRGLSSLSFPKICNHPILEVTFLSKPCLSAPQFSTLISLTSKQWKAKSKLEPTIKPFWNLIPGPVI